jgi:hypothetical protein
MLEVLMADWLDVGMTETLSNWDEDDENTDADDDKSLVRILVELEVVALPGCVLLSVEYWDDALLELEY